LLAKFPFQKQIQTSFENGDGDYRPRIPQYPQMQDILGTAVNEVLHGDKTAKQALDESQEQIAPLFK
jgi:multiple sugar transport system substrate-binding protein